ncbi:MAG: trifunctional transcriptional activator/DNA repair protein Ada/methylated-DNA--[protein]-cysteine S-methyltransferase [Pseudomonadota bacterium]
MLFELPDHKTLYEALINRDPAYDGQAFVCVASTGVFCRLTCPARKPKAENCTFYATVSECIEAGFRDCKRCHPLRPMANSDPTVASLIAALEERPHFRWRESDLERLGYDLSTVRRSFKRQFGMTFLEMARQRRLQHGFQAIARGERVVDAQLSAGFDSPSAFRTAFTKLIGKAPGHLSSRPLLFADWIRTPLGDMVAVTSKTQLHLLEFFDRRALPRELAKLERNTRGYIGVGPTDPSEQIKRELDDFFAGKSAHFNTPLAYHGSEFSREVWDALRTIPPGHTRSYSSLAKSLGRPNAVRAVARANGANQLALVVPCHRVIGADGSLTGYGGGLWRKQKLLEVERQYAVADQRKAVV